jgi:hypothetical protein
MVSAWQENMKRIYIDPGSLGNAGQAIFSCGKLTSANLLDKLEPIPWWSGEDEILVLEYPMIYPHGKTKRPNDIVTLAYAAGRLTANVPLNKIKKIHPRDWKGTIDADLVTNRILERLTPGERALIPDIPKDLLHNVIDAVGLGLWDLQRMRVGGGPV